MARLAFASMLALLAFSSVASAQRGRGGGGMVGRGGGNFNRPEFNQSFNRPQVNQNFNRPQVNQNFNRPQVNQNNNRTQFNQSNRTQVNQNINRPTTINNVNVNNVSNNHVNNNFGNINRGGYGGGGGYYGGYGGGARNWGYGGYGGGYHANSYYGYHSNWVNGSWGGNYRPGWGGYYGGYGGYGGYYNNFGNSALGIGAGIGIAAWGVGSLINSWGYSSYSNPYYSSLYGQQAVVISQPGAYDYSRPLDLASSPPAEPVIQTAEASFDSARQAFRSGDYVQALALADQALTQTPNDPMLHEFRAVSLFAQRRYDEAAVPFYTVLSSGPGWDWTTMIGLYPDVETYTSQLRALEAFANSNARAASARFVLAALYLTQGSTAAAATRLKEVVAIQPQDKLSAQLLASITSESQPAQAANPSQPAVNSDAVPANPTPAQAPELPKGPVPASLVGAWSASPGKDVTISLNIANDKSFTWKVLEKGQTREFKGEPTFDNDVLALAPPEMPPMVAKVTWKDNSHFNFKAVGTPADDPGLNFSR